MRHLSESGVRDGWGLESGAVFFFLSSQGAQPDYPGSLVSLERAKTGNPNMGV